MAAVKSSNTKPELAVRRRLHAAGFRYRLHLTSLPGKPDLVFPSRHKVIFVHGCFWHGHDCKRGARTPKRNQAYWIEKIDRNQKRDRKNIDALSALGWESFVIWECELRYLDTAISSLIDFLKKEREPDAVTGRSRA